MKLNGVDPHALTLPVGLSLSTFHVTRFLCNVLTGVRRAKGKLIMMMSRCYGGTLSETENISYSTYTVKYDAEKMVSSDEYDAPSHHFQRYLRS
jgi:hypothetical protein